MRICTQNRRLKIFAYPQPAIRLKKRTQRPNKEVFLPISTTISKMTENRVIDGLLDAY